MSDSPTHRLLKGRFAVVRRDLDEVVSRLDNDMLGWAPAEGMRTISGQLQEIAATEVQEQYLLQQTAGANYDAAFAAAMRSSVEEYRALLSETRAKTISIMEAWTEIELSESLAVPKGWFETLDQVAVPRAEIFRSLAAHEWYHTGQLVSYLWARGDNPYKW